MGVVWLPRNNKVEIEECVKSEVCFYPCAYYEFKRQTEVL